MVRVLTLRIFHAVVMPKTAKKKRVKKSDEHSFDFVEALLALPSSSFRKNPRNKLLLHLNSFLYINFYFIGIL